MSFNLIMKLTNFILEIFNLKFIKHYDIMVSMFTEKALKAYGAQTVFTKGLDVFSPVYFALG